jgi:hypothetical protein
LHSIHDSNVDNGEDGTKEGHQTRGSRLGARERYFDGSFEANRDQCDRKQSEKVSRTINVLVGFLKWVHY